MRRLSSRERDPNPRQPAWKTGPRGTYSIPGPTPKPCLARSLGLSLIRGFEFKSFTRWVKVYSGIHGLGALSTGQRQYSPAPVFTPDSRAQHDAHIAGSLNCEHVGSAALWARPLSLRFNPTAGTE